MSPPCTLEAAFFIDTPLDFTLHWETVNSMRRHNNKAGALRTLMNTTPCRNTLSFAAPLRTTRGRWIGSARVRRYCRSICRLTSGCPDVADCPTERSCSRSGCPSPSCYVAAPARGYPRKSSFRQESRAQTVPERSIAGAHRVPFLWSRERCAQEVRMPRTV